MAPCNMTRWRQHNTHSAQLHDQPTPAMRLPNSNAKVYYVQVPTHANWHAHSCWSRHSLHLSSHEFERMATKRLGTAHNHHECLSYNSANKFNTQLPGTCCRGCACIQMSSSPCTTHASSIRARRLAVQRANTVLTSWMPRALCTAVHPKFTFATNLRAVM
jgi:hypothetical protein